MALALYDRVRETSTIVGTGTATLLGAVPGYQSFSVVGNANTTYYCIFNTGTTEWEVGIGTYTSSGTTLSRTTILASSNSGSAVSFTAGTKDVFVTYPAGYTAFATNNATQASGQVLTSNGTGVGPTWQAAAGATITGTTATGTYYLVGTTSTSGSLTVASISNTNAVSYNASTGALTAVSVVSSSDERLKENWRNLPDAFLDDLAEVKHGSYSRIGNEWREVGVTAQSLMEVLPEAVNADDNGMLSVSYGNAALVAAIELAKEIKVLRAEIAELKAK
jgi:hypothetical protein